MNMLYMAVRLALRALLQNRMRAALTILGIQIGVAAVVAMTALGAGTQAHLAAQMSALGVNMLIVVPGAIATNGVRGAQGTAAGLTDEDARAIVQEVASVESAAPMLSAGVQGVVGDLNYSTRASGTTPDYFRVRNWPIASGALFDDADVTLGNKVCVIGETVRRNLFPGVTPIGSLLRIGTLPCRVIGVLASKGQSSFGQDQDDIILVPISTFRAHISRMTGDTVNAIFVSARSATLTHRAATGVTALLRQRHRLTDASDDDFTVRNLQELLSTFNAQQTALTFMLLIVAFIALLVGGIGIMNIMLVSVTERTREIGIRLAIGAQSGDILSQFLTEAVVLSALGGLSGLALGAIASFLLSLLTHWGVRIQVGSSLVAVAVATSVGLVFGFFPARRAAHLDPIVALRHE